MSPTKHRVYKLVAVLLCFSMLLVFQSSPLTAWAADNDESNAALEELNSKYEELEKQQQAIQAEIDKAKTEKDKQLAIKKQIDNQISLTRQQISVLESRITLLSETIAEQELVMEEKQKEIDSKYEVFKQRMRASYMAGDTTMLGLLFGADSFSEFLTRAEITARIAKHDQQLIDALNRDIEEVEAAKALVDEDKAKVEASKADMAAKQSTLNGQLQDVESQIQDIAALEADIKANKAKIDKEMAQVQSEIDKIYASMDSSGDYTGGKMLWPVPGYPNVTSNFGWRFNNTDYHTGIDISGANVHGKPIVAAASGTVYHTQLTYVPGKGYGKYVIIDHGGGISTLYGHTSEILVSPGQKVNRGDTIAKVGTTGWSTGPHLHFEVRVDGKYVNPWGYLNQ